ncbi:hypothetical protein V7O62_10205 [Methanolobus sp. ZRKC2]|uniref:DUF5817 domain-containing protein n=1 Tax=Methanolobus sp. ZRKC2 TaxID=3125783 RepID=UPI00324E707E
MIHQEFTMDAFGVIICPKCREHAQIIEISGTKTTRCQNCASNLEIRKLRLFMASDNLEEAVSARTLLQARLHGQENQLEEVFSETFVSANTDSSEEFGRFEVSIKDFTDKRELPVKKRDKNLLILDLLRSNGGKMEIGSLKDLAGEHGIDDQKFEQILEKLISAGEVYEPATGKICLI